MFTVEITTTAVVGRDWSLHRRVLDTVPGTLLLEDPEEPMLVVPVDATDTMAAARFVDGVCKLIGLSIVEGRIYPTPETDFDVPDDGGESAATPVESAVRAWMDETPTIRGHVTGDGHLLA